MMKSKANTETVHKLSTELSAKTGVSKDEVAKILDALGAGALLDNVANAAGVDRLKTLNVGDLRIAARLARSSHAI